MRLPGAEILIFAVTTLPAVAVPEDESPESRKLPLYAGAAAVDISPTTLPAIQNGGFLERSADRVAEPLYTRAISLRRGDERIAIAIVDTCMVPRTLCDDVKARVEREIGMPRDRILISATHTHTAPSAMNYCLGSRADPAYTKFLPPKIAEAIVLASKREQPAELGYTVAQAPDHTACRRWIRRVDRPDVDPFGERTIRAMMHPGYQNPDYVGPSGPEDPALSILAVRSLEGEPIAFLGNYSMHYFGFGGGFSPDFFGRFAQKVAAELAPGDDEFVGILSQGTSGDLWRGDYSRPADSIGIDEYTNQLVRIALDAASTMRYSRDVPLAMAEKRITLGRRLPSPERLAWAKKLFPDRSARPRNRPEVYAEQAFFIDENPTEEVVLQAVRIGGLGFTAIPCEVYALTGLELKARSPLQPTVNLSLSNGAAGYIPPPEQHALGGYTTWPARTAGLEVEAEPKIIGVVLELLEEVSGEKRREPPLVHGAYPAAVLASKPLAYWRFEEFRGPSVADSSGNGRNGTVVPRVAFHLPGPVSQAFSLERENRALHLAGGYLRAAGLEIDTDYSVELWFWNGVRRDARPVRGTIFARGTDVLTMVAGDEPNTTRLAFGTLEGKTSFGRNWNHVAVTRERERVRVFLNGKLEIDGEFSLGVVANPLVLVGGGHSDAPSLEGKIDEVAVFDRALTPQEVARHYAASGLASNGSSGPADSPAVPRSPPRSPEETLRAARIREGFRLELVAAEPLVRDPVAIDWDAEGRVWVAEMADYPSGTKGGNELGGRIRVLVDHDRDGRYDSSVLFADGLSFPNGVHAWRKGVIVTAAPEILYLEDADGDGRADRRKVLYTGFLPGNQQLRVNGLRWGLDNWIYCASGGHHAGYGADRRVRSKTTGEEIHLGSRDLRIHPATGALAAESGPSQFGRVRDDWGDWFGVQNSRPLWHYVLSDRYSGRNPYFAARGAKNHVRGVSPTLYPAKLPQKRYHSFEDATRFTSACGPGIYRDDLLFPFSDETHAFTCDPFHGIVQHAVLTRNGTSFDAIVDTPPGGRDFFASTDRWCRPVMARTGPDGALWIVDMYRYMIEHPEWLPPVGREELRPFYRSGDDRGRIYRVVPEGANPRPVPILANDSPAKLVRRLASSNGIVRDLAQRLLVEIGDATVASPLEQMVREHGDARARIHALATLAGIGALDARVVIAGLRDRHPRVARIALHLAEPLAEVPEVIAAAASLASSDDAPLRLQLAHTLGEWRDPLAGRALGALARRDHSDPWIRAAILSSALPHQEAIAEAIVADEGSFREFVSPLLAGALKTESYTVVTRLLSPLVCGESSDDDRIATWRFDAFARFLDTLAAESLALERLSAEHASFGELLEAGRATLARAAAVARDRSRPHEIRAAAVSLLGRREAHRSDERRFLEKILATSEPTNVQIAAIRRLRRLSGDATALIGPWRSFVPPVRAAAFDALLSRPDWTRSLLEAIERGTAPRMGFSAAERQRLLTVHGGKVAEEAKRILALETNRPREEAVRWLEPAVHLSGDARRGKDVFSAKCASCHALGDIGTAIGPDLRALTDRSAAALLTAIADPNAAVEPQYVAYSAVLDSGDVVHGLVAGETGNSLRFRLVDGTERVLLRSSIESLESSETSFMPEGLEVDLSLGDVADLLAFLQAP